MKPGDRIIPSSELKLKFQEPPRYVGGYHLGGPDALTFHLERRPWWLHRVMTRLLLGWVWVDEVTR